jgi:hypothetical protein
LDGLAYLACGSIRLAFIGLFAKRDAFSRVPFGKYARLRVAISPENRVITRFYWLDTPRYIDTRRGTVAP